MPLEASKSNAIRQLQCMLDCEKLIVFGDGKNDIDMFQRADERYAVANAHDDLKEYVESIKTFLNHQYFFLEVLQNQIIDFLFQV